jgi:hypothetical protein
LLQAWQQLLLLQQLQLLMQASKCMQMEQQSRVAGLTWTAS